MTLPRARVTTTLLTSMSSRSAQGRMRYGRATLLHPPHDLPFPPLRAVRTRRHATTHDGLALPRAVQERCLAPNVALAFVDVGERGHKACVCRSSFGGGPPSVLGNHPSACSPQPPPISGPAVAWCQTCPRSLVSSPHSRLLSSLSSPLLTLLPTLHLRPSSPNPRFPHDPSSPTMDSRSAPLPGELHLR